jgi:drug/metabolite transporter (DMT)-like permease
MSRFRADLLLLFAAGVWGLAFYFQKSAMSHIGPFLFIAARASVAALTLAPLALLELRRREKGMERPIFDRSALVRLGVMGGVFFFLGAAFQQAGLQTATVTNAGFLTGLYVVITPLIMWVTARRAPGSVVWTAVVLAFAGTWALGGGTVTGFSYGDILIAICAIFWSIHIVVTGRSPHFGVPMTYTCVQFATVAAIAAIAALLFEPISVDALARASGAILYVGVLSSALTFTLLAIALKHTPASEAAVLVSMETLFAALAGAVLLGERLPLIGLLGAALLFAASLLVQLAPRPKGIGDAA